MSGAGAFGRIVSRQAAHPTGVLGRLIGRIWVRETAGVNDAVLAALDPQPGETIVEIGHGPGRTLGRILEAGAAATGVEVSESMMGQARARNRQATLDGRLQLHLGDGIHLPLADGSADAVVAVHTIYFWPDPQTTLAECARILRPEGRLVIASRNGSVPLPRRLDPTIYAVPTPEELDEWLTNAGLEATSTHALGDVLTITATSTFGKDTTT